MGTFFCTECGFESFEENESICPHCNIPMEKLDYKDDMSEGSGETYPKKALKDVDSEDLDPEASLSDDLDLTGNEEEI